MCLLKKAANLYPIIRGAGRNSLKPVIFAALVE
jgi:hypothetical protein